MNDKRKQSEPEFLTGLKAFIERKQNEIIYNLAQKELNLRALLPQGEELSEREDTLLSRMEKLESGNPEEAQKVLGSYNEQGNVETASKELEYLTSSRDDILQGVGVMLPKGSKKKMRESSKKREEKFLKSLKEKPIMDRIKGFFRTDSSEDRALLNALESYNQDLGYRAKYSNRGGGGEKPLKAEYRKAIDTLLQQDKLGKRG
jgi:hypothetical protein